MAAGLYRSAPVFHAEVDRCAAILRPYLAGDVRDLMFADASEANAARLAQTAEAQVALFTVEYSLARQWLALGVRPTGMLGHSIGEWVAACLSGVFTLDEALRLVAARGRLMEAQPSGTMLAVARPEAELRPLLSGGLAVAAVNAPDQTVLSGTTEAISNLERTLTDRGVPSVRLRTSHAYHSSMMEPAARAFAAEFAGVPRRAPTLRWISNVTGTWVTDAEACDPDYWATHMLGTVRFSYGLAALLEAGATVLLEVGPGRTLAGLAARQPGWTAGHAVISSMRHAREGAPDNVAWLRAAGRLWEAGVALDWNSLYGDASRRRVPLPTYPFERQRCWIDAPVVSASTVRGEGVRKLPDLADWFYLPSWKRTLSPVDLPVVTGGGWMFVADADGLAEKLADRLRTSGADAEIVETGSDAAARLAVLCNAGRAPRWIVSLRDITRSSTEEPGYTELVALAQMLAGASLPEGTRLTVVANGLQAFAGEHSLQPEKALLHGPARVLQREVSGLAVRVVDIIRPATGGEAEALAERLIAEARSDNGGEFVALRGRDRWVRTLEPVKIGPSELPPLRERGVYLITGGLGGIGIVLAGELVRLVRARLVLVGRTAPNGTVLAQLAQFEAAGAEVITAALNVADEAALVRLREDVRQRWGKIDGVIHAAGIVGGGALAGRKQHEGEAVLLAKVAGTRALDRVFGSDSLDFFALMSSLTAQLGEFGQTDYAAANAFLDAFAEARHAAGVPVLSISWDAWRDTGMAARGSQHAGLADWAEQQRPLRITNAEGAEIFRRALSAGAGHLVISAQELGARMRAAETQDVLDRAALPRRALQPRPALTTPFVAPDHQLDRAVAALFTDLLGVGPVGVDDNFFELGGHSLLATQVIARLRQTHGAALTLPHFFSTPTVAGLARTMGKNGSHVEREPALRPAPRSGLLPLSYQQQALWLLDRVAGESPQMNELGAQTIRGPLDPKRLQECFNEVVRRHEVLRTRFVEREGQPAQDIAAIMHIDVPVVDISERSDIAQDTEIERLAAELVAMPFDIASGPLLRARLVRRGAEQHVVLVVVHHIVFDGWSAGVFFQEMLAFYDAATRGAEPVVAKLPIQYADFAVWQREWLQGARRTLLENYWKNRLGGNLPALALPTDLPRPPAQTFRGERLAAAFDAGRTRRLEALGRAHGASLFMTLLALLRTG
jgi:malonyl CoA-acyl carrier protein transacylase